MIHELKLRRQVKFILPLPKIENFSLMKTGRKQTESGQYDAFCARSLCQMRKSFAEKLEIRLIKKPKKNMYETSAGWNIETACRNMNSKKNPSKNSSALNPLNAFASSSQNPLDKSALCCMHLC